MGFFCSNRLTRDGAKELARLLRNDTMLKVLNLGHNRLGDDGAKHLASSLAAFNTNLQKWVVNHLYLCNLTLTDFVLYLVEWLL